MCEPWPVILSKMEGRVGLSFITTQQNTSIGSFTDGIPQPTLWAPRWVVLEEGKWEHPTAQNHKAWSQGQEGEDSVLDSCSSTTCIPPSHFHMRTRDWTVEQRLRKGSKLKSKTLQCLQPEFRERKQANKASFSLLGFSPSPPKSLAKTDTVVFIKKILFPNWWYRIIISACNQRSDLLQSNLWQGYAFLK